jgi:hypothetical protein
LKQFGFQRDGKWYISVWRKFLNHTDIELIENFSKEINIFDLPFEDFKLRRHFENTSGIVEVKYGTIIKTLAHQRQLIPKHKDILCHYIANIICRTKPYSEFFDQLLQNKQARSKFLNEITMFDESILPPLKEALNVLEKEFQLNIAIGFLMNHLVRVFRTFSFVILKDFDNRGWITSDNPVILDKQNNHSWIVPIEAEIYFPLSKDYCLFMFHTDSEMITNPLRELNGNKIANCDETLHKSIWDRILHNDNEFVIFPVEIGKTYFEGGAKNGT